MLLKTKCILLMFRLLLTTVVTTWAGLTVEERHILPPTGRLFQQFDEQQQQQQHEMEEIVTTTVKSRNEIVQFRHCADSSLCECSSKIVSCKRLNINSTEFNYLQHNSGGALSPFSLQELSVYRSNLTVLEAL